MFRNFFRKLFTGHAEEKFLGTEDFSRSTDNNKLPNHLENFGIRWMISGGDPSATNSSIIIPFFKH